MLQPASARPGRRHRREPVVGEMFGRYRLVEQLGAGGVGEVWRAVDTSLERVVALKMLLPRFRDDPESAARFHREARLAAGLRHPHIVRVHAFGEIDRRLYLDMELVEGESLAAALAAGGPLHPHRAADVVERIADALDTAHAVGGPADRRMVHRDVKPANILLEPRPRGREHVYLVDFGVARTVAASQQITGVGGVVGTPSYMAPELWEGRDSDHRVDVYALAVTAFEIVTGRLPYPRSTVEGLVTAHLTEPVPRPSELRPGLPVAVDAVLARGMAKDPAARHPSAGDLGEALTAALRVPSGPAATRPVTTGAPVPARPRAMPPRPAATGVPVSGPRADPGRTSGPPTVATSALRRPSAGPPSVPPPAHPTGPPAAPDRLDDPSAPRRPPYLASPPHFAGLATTALLLPLYLAGLLRADWTLLAAFFLLYALGAVLAAVLRPRRP